MRPRIGFPQTVHSNSTACRPVLIVLWPTYRLSEQSTAQDAALPRIGKGLVQLDRDLAAGRQASFRSWSTKRLDPRNTSKIRLAREEPPDGVAVGQNPWSSTAAAMTTALRVGDSTRRRRTVRSENVAILASPCVPGAAPPYLSRIPRGIRGQSNSFNPRPRSPLSR
jgi:hypothetical protein